jgi:hypothetical protein
VSELVIDVPSSGDGIVGWLLSRPRSGGAAFDNDIVSFRIRDGFGLSLGDRPLAAMTLAAPSDVVEVAPGVTVQSVGWDRLEDFLAKEWSAYDHVGLNLSHRDLHETEWQRLITAVAAELPAWRLEIGSANDIVMVVKEDSRRVSVVELVLDRRAEHSSFHLCARVAADRAAVEAAFPAPFGAYKPGDEPFFRSVALPISPRLPSYLDLAYSDAQMGPWPQIVAAMGMRIA